MATKRRPRTATKHRPQDKTTNMNPNELPRRQAPEYVSTYSNYVQIGTSPWDFQFLFFDMTEDEAGEMIREKKARVVMSPQHAVAFTQLLNETVAGWMKEHNPGVAENPEKEPGDK